MSAANPCESSGKFSVSVSVIIGASLGLAATPSVLPEVYVVSAAGSDATCLMVSTVAEPTAAFNLADISSVSEV